MSCYKTIIRIHKFPKTDKISNQKIDISSRTVLIPMESVALSDELFPLIYFHPQKKNLIGKCIRASYVSTTAQFSIHNIG